MAQLITYDQPPLAIKSGDFLPEAMAGKSFPYNELADHRRFEELLYNLISLKIEHNTFPGFDQVSLMNGVREKGRDCSLLRNGKNYGLIQCKKYQTKLSKQIFGTEITKFVLYSLLVPELIADSEDFTYYIAVTEGISCLEFIDDFKAQIAIAPELGSWIAKNIKHPSLAELVLRNPEKKVREILQKIKVIKILPPDLDNYLSEPACIHLQPLFFQLRVLVDSKPIQELTAALRAKNSGEFNTTQLNNELRRGSYSLRHEQNQFEQIPDSHIPRQETAELLNWILSPAKKDKQEKDLNICLLAGNAGMGKTVILKDLYDALVSKDIPVLGLKADKLYAVSISELQEKIGLTVPLFDFIEQCKAKYNQVVILIDQIDALSQAMFNGNGSLDVYKSLIDEYAHDPSVRMIISVRIFDLYYDPALRVYKDIQSIKVTKLEKATVHTLLAKLGFKAEDLSTKLLELLLVPNHLNVFSRIAAGFSGNLGLTSIQELYHELWKQKVIIKPGTMQIAPARLKKFMYKLANQMFKMQRISVSAHQFEDFQAELSYLESERLLKKEGKEIQFFHQTFYDFTYAKRFVEKKQDLIGYIKSQEQSILIRSAVKMILNYMREYDHPHYAKLMDTLLADPGIEYHMQQMLVSMLAFHDNPSHEEKSLLARNIPKSIHLLTHFLEHTRSANWFEFIIVKETFPDIFSSKTDHLAFPDMDGDSEQGQIEINHLRYAAKNLVSHFVQKNHPRAWTFISSLEQGWLLKSILFELNDWSDDLAYELLEKCADFSEVDYLGYMTIMEKISDYRPEYAWWKIEERLVADDIVDKDSHKDYDELQVLSALSKHIPEKMISSLTQIIVKNLNWENILLRPLTGDYTFTKVNLTDSEDLFGRQYLYQLLALCLRKAANKQAKEFYTFLSNYCRSNHKAMLRLVVFALETNEQSYTQEVYNLFCYLREIGSLKEGEDFSVEFRVIFGNAFPYFNPKQQAEVIATLKNLVIKEEAYVMSRSDKPYRIEYWGRGKYAYLLKLPPGVIEADNELKRQFKELARKHGNYKDRSSLGPVLAGIVGRPLPNGAYSKMSADQWLKSFRKYSGERDRFATDYLKGGIEEHSSAFKDAASKGDHEQMFSIIEQIIEAGDIKIIYALEGLRGLAEADADQNRLTAIFKTLLSHPEGKKEVRSLLYIGKNLVGNDHDDPEVVNFLIAQSENYLDLKCKRSAASGDTSTGGLITRGINTIHGAAAQALLYVYDPAMEHRIFTALENLLKTAPEETRAALYFRFAHLNHLNRARAYALFSTRLKQEKNIYVIASSIWSLQYMGNYDFEGLTDVYKKLVKSDIVGSDDAHWLFSILYFSHLYNKDGAEPLLYELLDHNPKSRTWALNECCKNFKHSEDSAVKSLPIMMYLVTKFSNDEEDPLQIRYLHLDHINLPEIYDFLEACIHSKAFKINHNLLEYLTLQCNAHYLKCITLFNLAISKLNNHTKNKGYIKHDEDLSKFIIGAFTALKGDDPVSQAHRKQLMDSFYVLLKDVRFKKDAEKILDELL